MPMQTVAQLPAHRGEAVGDQPLTDVPRISRHWLLRICTGIASILVAYGFCRKVAGGDYRMQTFLFIAVSVGVFITLSGLVDQWRRGN